MTNNLLWLDGILLVESASDIIAATFMPSAQAPSSKIILAISSDQVYLFNQQGDLIDQLGEELGLPKNINAASVDGRNIIVRSAVGYFQADAALFEWQKVNFVIEPNWIIPIKASEKTTANAELIYRSQFLTLERIILDAHSGRIFGLFGVLFMDAVAILLILLSLSGVYIWIRYARAKR